MVNCADGNKYEITEENDESVGYVQVDKGFWTYNEFGK
jgi:hypothetical protein